jgi:L-amino acid N-acyltransferase YncA
MLPVTGHEAQTGARQARDRYVVRPAAERDLDAIAEFEVDIARVSFGDEAITDAAFHRRRVAGAVGKAGEITLVAVAADAPDVPLGWAWMSARTNSLTGERYGNFRSLAVADPDTFTSADAGTGAGAGTGLDAVAGASPRLGELLMAAILRAADEAGFTHLSGKVNAANLGMRSLYRAFGFSATHLTMEKRTRQDGRS